MEIILFHMLIGVGDIYKIGVTNMTFNLIFIDVNSFNVIINGRKDACEESISKKHYHIKLFLVCTHAQ